MNRSLTLPGKLMGYVQMADSAARTLGFASFGDIERFMFAAIGKALRAISAPDRPNGVIFFIEPGSSCTPVVSSSAVRPVLHQLCNESTKTFYALPIDAPQNVHAIVNTSTADRLHLQGSAWPRGYAQFCSRTTGKCVAWLSGVGAVVYINGDCCMESADIVEELDSGVPGDFQALSWQDGEISFDFSNLELNDTSPIGVWHLPDVLLLKPKPERLISAMFGRFLRYRMAGYRHHEEEPHVDNEGRADIVLTLINGLTFIVEVKWTGTSLSSAKQLESEAAIRAAMKRNLPNWLTAFDDNTIAPGVRQIVRYYSTSKYQRAYLIVFDCCRPTRGRKSEVVPVYAATVAPHDVTKFKVLRACTDPRKASKRAKAMNP